MESPVNISNISLFWVVVHDVYHGILDNYSIHVSDSVSDVIYHKKHNKKSKN